jgi:intron-binding protein aquarius
VLYAERFLEFLSDLLSQLPTRRYVNSLLEDLLLIPSLRLSPTYSDEDNGLLRDLCDLLSYYKHFSIDDHTGVQLGRTEAYEKHCNLLAKLQRIALKHFKEKLTVLALSNYGSIDKREDLAGLLEPLSDGELGELMSLVGLRTAFPPSVKMEMDRRFRTEVLLSTFERRKTFQEMAQELTILPNEKTLFDQTLTRTEHYDGSHPLALPKLNLQYLSVGDFLWRALVLYRCESFYGIRRDVEDTLARLKPESRRSGETSFAGFSKMALPISRPRCVV